MPAEFRCAASATCLPSGTGYDISRSTPDGPFGLHTEPPVSSLEDESALRPVIDQAADVSGGYRQHLGGWCSSGSVDEGSAADNQVSLAELAALAQKPPAFRCSKDSSACDGPTVDPHRLGRGRTPRSDRGDRRRHRHLRRRGTVAGAVDARKVKVIDRTALILDIFAQHATSREGAKAQVSLGWVCCGCAWGGGRCLAGGRSRRWQWRG